MAIAGMFFTGINFYDGQGFMVRKKLGVDSALKLDGAFSLQLSGPAKSNYDMVLRSGGKLVQKTDAPGSSDRIHYRIACRDRQTETLTVQVKHRSGAPGPVSVKATYAG